MQKKRKLVLVIFLVILLSTSVVSSQTSLQQKNTCENERCDNFCIYTNENLEKNQPSPVHSQLLYDNVNQNFDIIVPDDYSTIQEAINNAETGDIIFIKNGNYNENLIISKSGISLYGENRETSVINGGDNGNAIIITGSFNIISNLKIRNNDIQDAALFIDKSSGNQIENNKIESTKGDAIYLDRSYVNLIEDNSISNNGDNGIRISSSCIGNIISSNTISSNNNAGIIIEEGSRRNFVNKNHIENNDYGLKIIDYAQYNTIIENTFTNNEQNAYDEEFNYWDNNYNKGNYWDDYMGSDSNSDGIGDTPYYIPGGSNEDHYPLIFPPSIFSYPESDGTNEINFDTNSDDSSALYYSSLNSNIIVPDDYSTIQGAIDHANDGSTIEVRPGTYLENIVIDKSITIFGQNKDTTIIDGFDKEHIVLISANNVHFRDFTVRNTELGYAGIKTGSDNTIIENCIINECGVGIHLFDTSENILQNNKIYGNNWGVFNEFSYETSLLNTEIVGNNDGVVIWNTDTFEISDCRINNNHYEGIMHFNSENSIIVNNSIEDNEDIGIQIFNSNNNELKDNNLMDNFKSGIQVYKSENNYFTNNVFDENKNSGISFWFNSEENTISNNLFTSNNVNALSFWKSSKNIVEINDIREGNRGISLFSESHYCQINQNILTDVGVEGIRIDNSSYNTIMNNSFSGCTIFLYSSEQNIITGNTVNGKPLIYLEDEIDKEVSEGGQVILVRCHNITIHNFEISNLPIGIQLFGSSECTIRNNQIVDCSQHGIYIGDDSVNNDINENFISNNLNGIYLSNANYNTLSDNIISDNDQNGIYLLDHANSNTILENEIKNNIVSGIKFLDTCKLNAIQLNTIQENGDGIYVSQCSSNSIINNYIGDNNNYAVQIVNGGYNTIENNTLTKNKFGLYIWHSNSNTVTGNNITYQNEKGMVIEKSDYNKILSNDISNNDVGIDMDDAYDNEIKYNTFSHNKDMGINEIFTDSYPLESPDEGDGANSIHYNNFIQNKKHVFFRSEQIGIILGHLWYWGMHNWDKNYWDDWDGGGDYRILGEMFVYRNKFKVGIHIDDDYPSLNPYYLRTTEKRSFDYTILCDSITDSSTHSSPKNKFEIGDTVYTFSELSNIKEGDIIRWIWYHNQSAIHINEDTIPFEGNVNLWDHWTPNEKGWWQIDIYCNDEYIGSSPAFAIYSKTPKLTYTVLTDSVTEFKPQPIITRPSNKFEYGNTVYTYSEMENAKQGDVITWQWFHDGEIKHVKEETLPFNGVVFFWDDWAPNEKGWWNIAILINGEIFGYSPDFNVLESIDNNRIGLGEAFTCKWVKDKDDHAPQSILFGEKNVIHCYSTFTAKNYNWQGDSFEYKWIHNGQIINSGVETNNQDYSGDICFYIYQQNIPIGTGYVELYWNGNYLGKTNTYQVLHDYQYISEEVQLGEALTCNLVTGNNHGPIITTFNILQDVHFYCTFTSNDYDWYGDFLEYRWTHNGNLIDSKTEYISDHYSGTITMYSFKSRLPIGDGYIEFYWNGEYTGKTNEYEIIST